MDVLEEIRRNTETFIGDEALGERIAAGKKLRVKLGVDPTRPDLTFGHLVVFNKLRLFQDMGHEAVLIIGDFTSLIGDPSGRSSVRPVLTPEEVRANAQTYVDQAYKVLDRAKTTVCFNSEWFGKMSFSDTLQLARQMTVARMLERDDFAKRHAAGSPISLVEFLYPLVQGHDSVVLKADVEIGGSDQLFNMLVGRQLQKDQGLPEQAVMTMPLLLGLDGQRKMSKSLDNYIAFTDTPKDMFGKIMSISDKVMWDYYRLLLEVDEARISQRRRDDHPMEAKKQLAVALVSRFHGEAAGTNERAQFEKVFSKGQLPDAMPEFDWTALGGAADASVVDLAAQTQLFPSKKEIKRLLEQGALKVNEAPVRKDSPRIDRPSEPVVVQAGKRIFFRINP
ncbi:MAG: tyrosine--tRNA ligase [Opitutales bacterium]